MSLQLGWIPVRKTVNLDEDVDAHDVITIDVRLLPILDEQSLHDMLRDGLEKRGWTRNADGSMTKQFGAATATLPAGATAITLEVSDQTSVAVEASVDGAAPQDNGQAEQDALQNEAQRAAEKKLARAKDGARKSLERKNAEKLLEVEPDLRAEVTSVVNEVTRGALERRARALGEIETIEEGRGEDGGYELTITVKT